MFLTSSSMFQTVQYKMIGNTRPQTAVPIRPCSLFPSKNTRAMNILRFETINFLSKMTNFGSKMTVLDFKFYTWNFSGKYQTSYPLLPIILSVPKLNFEHVCLNAYVHEWIFRELFSNINFGLSLSWRFTQLSYYSWI